MQCKWSCVLRKMLSLDTNVRDQRLFLCSRRCLSSTPYPVPGMEYWTWQCRNCVAKTKVLFCGAHSMLFPTLFRYYGLGFYSWLPILLVAVNDALLTLKALLAMNFSLMFGTDNDSDIINVEIACHLILAGKINTNMVIIATDEEGVRTCSYARVYLVISLPPSVPDSMCYPLIYRIPKFFVSLAFYETVTVVSVPNIPLFLMRSPALSCVTCCQCLCKISLLKSKKCHAPSADLLGMLI